MKILILNSFYYPNILGGAEISVRHLAEELKVAGHDVVVICLGREELVQEVNGVKVYYVPLSNIYFPFDRRPAWFLRLVWNLLDIYNPVMVKRFGDILDKERPDVVHSNILLGFSCGVWRAASRRNIRLVHTIQDHLLLCPRSTMYKRGSNCTKQCFSCKLFSFVKRVMNVEVDNVIGVSKYILNRHLSLGWFQSANQRVIFDSFSPTEVRNQREDNQLLRFGYIGRITEFKGIELLLSSFVTLCQDRKVELWIAGTGEDDYVARMKKMSKDADVKFVGFVERGDFYSQIDVVIVPSLVQEALGRAVLEAYAYGIPVIASRRGGIPEIIDEGKTGLLFDPQKDGDLKRTLEHVMSESWQGKSMSVACLLKSEEFKEEVIAKKYMDVYETKTNPCSLPSHLNGFGR